jgi:chemotaxis protein histidine kinase CheA
VRRQITTVKSIVTTLCAIVLLLQGCDSGKPKADPLQAERDRLEAERVALAAEKTRISQEQELAQKKAEAEKEAGKLAAERAKLEAEKEKFMAEQTRLENDKITLTEAEKAARREMAARIAEQKATLEMASAQGAEERRQLEILKAQAENDRLAAERAAVEAKAREAAMKRAEAEATSKRTISLFYEALATHGDWFDTDRHGYVWRPKRAAVRHDWRPYTDGRWQWTDYGWTWQSLEPFGWAVYHYGRWFRHPRVGWLWVPGHEWAPAWVTWRVKSSEFVGWAPLPPEAQSSQGYNAGVDSKFDIGPGSYVFLAMKDFDEPTYLHKFVSPDRRMEAIRGSRNVTQLISRGPTMVAGGPDPGMIASVIRQQREDPDAQPLPRLTLVLADRPVSKESGDVIEAGAMMLFAPKIEKGTPSAKPAAVHEKVNAQDVDKGMADTTPETETEWRAMVGREAAYAAEVEKAAKNPPRHNPARAAVRQPPKATPTPTPRPVVRPTTRPNQKPNSLNPATLQPSQPLFGN